MALFLRALLTSVALLNLVPSARAQEPPGMLPNPVTHSALPSSYVDPLVMSRPAAFAGEFQVSPRENAT